MMFRCRSCRTIFSISEFTETHDVKVQMWAKESDLRPGVCPECASIFTPHEDEREREVSEESMCSGTPSYSCDLCRNWSAKPRVYLGKQFGAACDKCFGEWEATDSCETWPQFVERRRNVPPPIKKPAAPANDPQNIWIRTTGVCENLAVKEGSLVKVHPDELPASTPELVAEAIKVGVERINERRAIVLGEARACLSLRSTWPACPTDHLSLNIDHVEQSGAIVLRCPECRELRAIRVTLSPKALRALEAAGGAVRA